MSKKIDPIVSDLYRLAPTRSASEFFALEKLRFERSMPAGRVIQMPDINPMPPELMHDVAMPEINFLAHMLQTDNKFYEIARDRSRLKDVLARAWARFVENREAAKEAYEKMTSQQVNLNHIGYQTFLLHFLALRDYHKHVVTDQKALTEYLLALSKYSIQQDRDSFTQQAATAEARTLIKNMQASHHTVQQDMLQQSRLSQHGDVNQSEMQLGLAVAMSVYHQHLTAWQSLVSRSAPASGGDTRPRLRIKAAS